MKWAITSAPVLQQIDENKPYVIETDSSDFANEMETEQIMAKPTIFLTFLDPDKFNVMGGESC